MAPRLASQFCAEVDTALHNADPLKLQSILVLEPPFGPIYQQLIAELRADYPASDETADARLEDVVRTTVTETAETEDAEGRPVQNWAAMTTFLAGWMSFIRDVDVENLLTTYEALSDLQQKVNTALQHPTKGILVLPTLIAYANVFARVAVGLDRRPELVEHLVAATVTEEGGRESLAEKAANVIRQAFVTCLNDKNTVPGGIKGGRPDGKKIGVYKTANVCLKILFQTNKLDNCPMIFKNITASSPPLHFYPAADRVTYLYYLGRHQFISDDFYQAQLILQKAYEECAVDSSCSKQRRLIFRYLLLANFMLGRFPTEEAYSRAEAKGLRPIFQPLVRAIRKGDLESFRRITSLDLTYEHVNVLLRWGVFYKIRSCTEVLVWRSLFRKVFMLTGQQQGVTERSAPTLDLKAVLAATLYFEKRARMTPGMAQASSDPRRHTAFAILDFATHDNYVDPDFDGLDLKPCEHVPDVMEIECICGSLIMQSLLHGYISHKQSKFAIQGAKRAGSAVKAGFPVPWQVFEKRNLEAGRDEVLGWVKDMQSAGASQVVRLAGARPAGS